MILIKPVAVAVTWLVLGVLAGLACDDTPEVGVPGGGAPDVGAPEAEDGEAALGAGLFVFGAGPGPVNDSAFVAGSNPLIGWRALEPEEGRYDWDVLDDAIAEASAAKSKVVPRILTNASLFGQPAPDWFFETEGAAHYYPSAQAESEGFKAPVPWDPVFREKFGNFLVALGQRYNDNSTIEFFQTSAGGGLYGEVVLTKDDSRFPEGWSPEVHLTSITYWLDRWIEAFPATRLALMVNHVGYDIGENAAAYAAGRGIYLQQNTPWLTPEGIAIFMAHQETTEIILEAEDGCNSTDEQAFEKLVETVFGYGFAIDYLHLCSESLGDSITAAELSSIWQRLRH